MIKKIKWYGEIPTESKSWLSFVVQNGMGYEYDDINRPSKIIVTSDDNNGSITDSIQLKLEKNNTIEKRSAIVKFYQDGGNTLFYKVSQKKGHVKVPTKTELRLKENINKAIVINPKEVNCEFDTKTLSFTADFTYNEVNEKYTIGYYADTEEAYEDLTETITSDTKTVNDVNLFTWSSDNGSISNGVLSLNKNTNKEKAKTYNVTVSYSGVNDTASVIQGVEPPPKPKTKYFEIVTNLKNAVVEFSNADKSFTKTATTVSDNDKYKARIEIEEPLIQQYGAIYGKITNNLPEEIKRNPQIGIKLPNGSNYETNISRNNYEFIGGNLNVLVHTTLDVTKYSYEGNNSEIQPDSSLEITFKTIETQEAIGYKCSLDKHVLPDEMIEDNMTNSFNSFIKNDAIVLHVKPNDGETERSRVILFNTEEINGVTKTATLTLTQMPNFDNIKNRRFVCYFQTKLTDDVGLSLRDNVKSYIITYKLNGETKVIKKSGNEFILIEEDNNRVVFAQLEIPYSNNMENFTFRVENIVLGKDLEKLVNTSFSHEKFDDDTNSWHVINDEIHLKDNITYVLVSALQ